MKKALIFKWCMMVVILFLLSGCRQPAGGENHQDETGFTFVFMTDIHLQPELDAPAGFSKALEAINSLHPDFVLTGGDLIMDALGVSYGRADTLYRLYDSLISQLDVPVRNTMGNHELFGILGMSDAGPDHPEYGERIYEKRIGRRYYSFDHKGWHFMVLDGIEDTHEGGYIGMVDSTQMDWIRTDLDGIGPGVPIVVSTHIPFVTVATQLEKGALEPNGKGTVVNNSKEVLDLFDGFNLKLVLQGHLHYLEDIHAGGIHFITGGAVSSRWWGGRYRGMEEGFVLLKMSGDAFTWEYVDYGWEAGEVENWD